MSIATPDLRCTLDERREHVRDAEALYGLDYLEVGPTQLTLTVTFLGSAPPQLKKENFEILGGRRITEIRVLAATVHRATDPELDDTVTLQLDKYGDFSTYTLRLVDVADAIDPLYDRLDFTFKIDCGSDLDCKQEPICPPPVLVEPTIDYLAKDYDTFRQLILDRLAVIMPDWRERHSADIGIMLIEILAYVGDYLSYYQDAVATEAYIATARQRIAVRRHARLVDYRMHEGCNARAWICIETDSEFTLTPDALFLTGLNGPLAALGTMITIDDLDRLPSDAYEAFQMVGDVDVTVTRARSTIKFYTWGNRECCLRRGSTRATLCADKETIGLLPGDVIIIEEIVGPKTGDPADADPSHSCAVRLVEVSKVTDPLDPERPLIDVRWKREDAPPFPVCLTTLGAPSACEYIEVSVVRANVLLVDHGRTISKEDVGTVPSLPLPLRCECVGVVAETALVPGPFSPTLSQAPLTYRVPFDPTVAASLASLQDPRKALPQITMDGWIPQFDLLASTGDDKHVVVEIDDDGYGHIRFGDGLMGRLPDPNVTFAATYRVGNGTTGNVGAEAIAHIATSETISDGVVRVRNPLPASGGIDPEPIANVKAFAPAKFRRDLERAVTPDDYAQLAQRDPAVLRSAAELRWSGSWHEMQVAVEPRCGEDPDERLLDRVEDELDTYRRVGYDLDVTAPRFVPLDVALCVVVKDDYLQGHVKAALLEVFTSCVRPDGTLGFFHPSNLPFGGAIYVSRIIAAAVAVDGVESARVTKLEREFVGPNHELDDGVLRLGVLEVARCDNDPNYPENGRFMLVMVGGR